jgi:hypothetical protein
MPHPDLNRQVALDHLTTLRRAAESFRLSHSVTARTPRPISTSIQLRLSQCRSELERLAALSERPASNGEWLVADVDGIPVAAVSIDDGTTLYDPFKPTQQIVSLLKLRRKQVLAAA